MLMLIDDEYYQIIEDQQFTDHIQNIIKIYNCRTYFRNAQMNCNSFNSIPNFLVSFRLIIKY